MVSAGNYLTRVSFPGSMASLESESVGRMKLWGRMVTAVRNQDKER